MARTKHKLTALQVKQCTPGTYTDGDGLYLHVALGNNGQRNRWWYVRAHLPGGKVREMGLGSVDRVDLATARKEAQKARELAREGIDPVWHRKERLRKAAEESARIITFKQATEAYLDANEDSWRNEKHGRVPERGVGADALRGGPTVCLARSYASGHTVPGIEAPRNARAKP